MRQLDAARDAAEEYEQRGAQVVAINPGDLASHQAWAEQAGYRFPIVHDEQGKIAAAYGALKPEGSIQRTVYILDRQGAVRYAQQGLPETAELLEHIDQIGQADNPPRRSGY